MVTQTPGPHATLPSWLTEVAGEHLQQSGPPVVRQSVAVKPVSTAESSGPQNSTLASWLTEATGVTIMRPSPVVAVPPSLKVPGPLLSTTSSTPVAKMPSVLQVHNNNRDIMANAVFLADINEETTAKLPARSHVSSCSLSEFSVGENPLPSHMATPLQDERQEASVMDEILRPFETDPLMLETCVPTQDATTQVNIDDPEKKEMTQMLCKLLSELKKRTTLIEQQNKVLSSVSENVSSLASGTRRIERKVTAMERFKGSQQENVDATAPLKRKKF